MSTDEGEARQRQVPIVNSYGLHMRPAGKFIALANTFESEIRVEHEGKLVDGKSLLDMTCLAAERGSTLVLRARGPDADDALDALAELIAAGFHMSEEDYEQENLT